MDAPITPPTRTAADDREVVAGLLGRSPKGLFDVVVRDDAGVPVVIRNHPLLEDGRPMPTRFWLVGDDLRSWIGTLESTGGVRAAEADCDPVELADAHARYAWFLAGGDDPVGRWVHARLKDLPAPKARSGG